MYLFPLVWFTGFFICVVLYYDNSYFFFFGESIASMAYSAWAMSKHLGGGGGGGGGGESAGAQKWPPRNYTVRIPSPRRLRRDRLVLFVRSHQSTATVSGWHSLRPWSSFVTVYYDLVVVLCIFYLYASRSIIYVPDVVVSKISALSKFLFHVAKTRQFF